MSHPVGAGSGPSGAHPLNDDDKHRRGAWWWWLVALLLVALLALLVVLLIRHLNSSDDKTTAAKKSITAPATDPSTPASVPASSPASVPASVPTSSPAASGPAVAAASCAKPTLTVAPKTVRAGQSVTVSGRHFSGCRAAGGSAAPAATLPVQIGVGDADVVTVIGNARTRATGAFDVTLVIPGSVTTGRTARLTMHAASRDAGTTLGYAGATTVGYTASSGGGMPTAVPAGSGGQAATTSGSGDDGAELALLAAGLLLCGGGALGLTRHRSAR